jgi:glycosyltransferase involved in cell wall biosynthesis
MHGLRVLHVTPYAPGAWGYGGIPRLTGALASGLAARGHAVTVCATDACDADRRLAQGAVDDVDPQAGGRIDLRIFRNLSNTLAYRYQCFLPSGLSEYLRLHARDFDVAHLHACRNFPGAIAAHHLHRAGVPFVLAPNGTAVNIERRRALKFAFDVVAGRRVIGRAARLLAVSEAERRQLERIGVAAERIRVVPNPLELGGFRSARGLEMTWRRRGGPLVVYLGQLTPRKRVSLLVRAFARLSDAAATLVIAGNDMGAEADARRAAADTGVAARTEFTGLLSGADRIELLASADVVVYPSEHEAFGLVPLEALLAGTPVVVADDCGCGEIIRSVGGGIVVPGAVGPLTAAIETVLGRPHDWRKRAAEAAGRVRARFGPETVCSELEVVYAELTAAA